MDQIGSVTELVTAQGVGAVAALGAVIGDDAAFRLLHGRGTLCDVVLASQALGVDTVQAVLEYAREVLGGVADGTVGEGESGSRCA